MFLLNGMEYSLSRRVGVNICGSVDRVLNWDTDGLGCTPEDVALNIFFFFFFNLPQNELIFPG